MSARAAAGAARLFIIVAAMIAVTACASTRARGLSSNPAIKVAQHTTYYQVDLLDPRTLTRALWDMGMANQSGVVGLTSSNYQWSFVVEPTAPGQCTVKSVRVTGELRITLPRWTAPTGTSPERRQWWQSYSSGVNTHENTHVQILHDYFREMLTTLEGMTGNDCTRLRDRANSVLRDAAAAMQERQREFDQTDRGMVIGYPPPQVM